MSGIFQTLLGSLAGVVKDTFFQYVTLLLPGNGTNGAQNNTFTDASTNNFTITRNGNTTQGTFSPYGDNWGVFFSGAATNTGVSLPSSSEFQFGTGDFCIEAWVFPNSLSSYFFNTCANSGGAGGLSLFLDASGNLGVFSFVSNATVLTGSGTTAAIGAWSHVAVSRSGTTLRAFVNGTQVGSTTNSQNFQGTSSQGGIGAWASSSAAPFVGYISNMRVLKGSALYTGAYTVPTAPLTAITNTVLLACQSNRLIDNSTNAFALANINTTNTVSVQRFSPFSPTDAYSASVIGGSGYFDGTGDYLTVPDSAALEFGSGNWTIEGWFYVTSGTTQRVLFGRDNNVDADVLIRLNGGANDLEVYLSSNGTTFGITSTGAISGATVNYNAWNHFAVTSSGGTIRKGINGVMASIGTLASIFNSTKTWYVGARGNVSEYFPGYISDLRVVVGTAVYAASTYTVPTAPLTAITNTSLLLNFTNAGIIDNAMLNDLETVGNAQISTAQSKFGGSSMYFDGTGDRLTAAANPNIALGTGDFTIELWVYSLDVSVSERGMFQTSDTSGGLKTTYTTGVVAYFKASGEMAANVGGTIYTTSSAGISQSVWHHIAVTRASGNVNIWVNGTSRATGSGNTANLSGQNIVVGGYFSTSYLLDGYIDDLRITKGVARYTANFTAPTAAFPTS